MEAQPHAPKEILYRAVPTLIQALTENGASMRMSGSDSPTPLDALVAITGKTFTPRENRFGRSSFDREKEDLADIADQYRKLYYQELLPATEKKAVDIVKEGDQAAPK